MVLILEAYNSVGILPAVFCVISFERTLITVAEREKSLSNYTAITFDTCDVILQLITGVHIIYRTTEAWNIFRHSVNFTGI